jgi:hypothetical protein
MSAVVLATVALAMTTGCSGGGDDDSKASSTAESKLTGTDFEAVCSGASLSKATPYDKTAASHKALYFETGPYGWSDNSITVLPKDWQVAYTAQGVDYGPVDLVACAKRTADEQVKVCDGYKSNGKATKNKIRWYDATYELSVRQATTGKELAKETVEAKAGECPMIASFSGDNETKDDYASVPKEVVIDLLKPFAQP